MQRSPFLRQLQPPVAIAGANGVVTACLSGLGMVSRVERFWAKTSFLAVEYERRACVYTVQGRERPSGQGFNNRQEFLPDRVIAIPLARRKPFEGLARTDEIPLTGRRSELDNRRTAVRRYRLFTTSSVCWVVSSQMEDRPQNLANRQVRPPRENHVTQARSRPSRI